MERSVAHARELEALKRRTNDLWEEIEQVDEMAVGVMRDLVEIGRRVDELRAAEQVDTRMPAIEAVTHLPSHVGEQGGGKRRRLRARPMERQDSSTEPDSQAGHASESGDRVFHDEVQGMERSGASSDSGGRTIHVYHDEVQAIDLLEFAACGFLPEESLSWSSAEESPSCSSSD